MKWPRIYAKEIEALPTKEERRAALELVPEHIRGLVREHVNDYFTRKAWNEYVASKKSAGFRTGNKNIKSQKAPLHRGAYSRGAKIKRAEPFTTKMVTGSAGSGRYDGGTVSGILQAALRGADPPERK